MEARTKWLWIVTLANIAVGFLLILAIRGIMLALGVLTPEIFVWPVFVFLPIGVALSVVGLKLTRGDASFASRRIAYVANGCALGFSLLIVTGLATLFLGSTEERFLVPNGYKGDVYVVYGAMDGQPTTKTFWGVTYSIPDDGILRTRGPMIRGWTRTRYYYRLGNGTLERIRNFWPNTIHRTPENLANDSDIGVFFPRTGRFSDSAGCSVEYDQFYVGTKAHLLSKYRRTDIGSYVRAHPLGCSNQPK
jgi:Family of unknown function (DUF6843)